MASLGPINAHETLDTFRDLAESFSIVNRPIHGLGKVGLEAYGRAVRDIVSLYFKDKAEQEQVIQDMRRPNCVIVERRVTPQKIAVRAAVLGETATMAACFAIGLEYGHYGKSSGEAPRPQRLLTELSYERASSWRGFSTNWPPPFALPETDDIDPRIGAAVRANYDRGFGVVLGVVQHFNTILTPVANDVWPDRSEEG